MVSSRYLYWIMYYRFQFFNVPKKGEKMSSVLIGLCVMVGIFLLNWAFGSRSK